MSSVVWDAERRPLSGERELRNARRVSYWPLSFIDDINGVRVGGEKEMGKALEEAGSAAGILWDKGKNWKGKKGKHLGVVMRDVRRHQKYRCQKAKAVWEVVKRLNRLPPREKRKIAV